MAMFRYETLDSKGPNSKQEMVALSLKQQINQLLDQYENLIEYWIEITHNPMSKDNQGVILKVCLRSDDKNLLHQLENELAQHICEYKISTEEYDTSGDAIDTNFPQVYFEGDETIEDFDKAFDPGVVLLPDSMPLKYSVSTDELFNKKDLTTIDFIGMPEDEFMAEARLHPEEFGTPMVEFNLHKILFIEIP